MNKVAVTILILVLLTASAVIAAEDKMSAAIATLNVADATPAAEATKETATEIGISVSEILPGNGTRAGYVLGHGNVIPDSEWVYIGAKRATRNKDYTIDYASGTLFFSEPIRQTDSVRVDYRYSEKAKGERSVTGPGALPFRIGGGLQMNMVYSYRTADPKLGFGAPDILTYGVNTSTKIGSSSNWSGMMYMSSPESNNRMTLNATPTAPGNQPTVKKDRMIVQNADLGLGKVKLKLGFQDVGQDFAGFQSLRESKAAPDDVLNQLEKEKGIKRMDFAGEFASGASSAFNFSMGKISDKGDDITSRSFGYNSDNLKFNFSSREVGKGFSMFAQLRENDRAQLAAEVGMKRTNIGLQFRTGMAEENKPIWSALSFTELSGETGSLSYRSVDLNFGSVQVQADSRSMDPTFNRMAALNDAERTRMALIARRQFNPNAKVEEVTAKDKAQINQEAGLNRTNYIVQVDNSWLTLSSIESENADLKRRAIHLGTKWFDFDYFHHKIDEDFNRIAHLQPVEMERYGNEFGMSRTELRGGFSILGGTAAFSNANVTDHQGASVVRRSLDYKSNRLKFRANFQDIDPEFSRIMDLSDSDRKLMLQERGFKRADYWINFQPTDKLNIDSYLYSSTNPTEGQMRDQARHKIAYKFGQGREITFFSDDYSYISETGNLSSYARQKVTFDTNINLLGGLQFKSLSDINTNQEGSAIPQTTTISQYRLESNQNAPTAFTLDMLDIDYGDGRFEDTRGLAIKTKALGKLSFTGAYSTTAREDNKSEANSSLGIEYPLGKDLAMSFKLNNRDGGPKGSQQSHNFTLKGTLAKNFLGLTNIKIDSCSNSTVLTGRQTACDNGLKLEAGFLGGNVLFDNSDKLNPKNGLYYTSRVIQYESDKDPKKWYHFTFFRQNLITPAGEPAKKRNYALDMKLSPRTNLTFSSHYGKDGQNGAVLNLGRTVFKLNHALGNGLSLVADYKKDINDATGRHARVFGMGLTGTLSRNGSWEFYLGRANLQEAQQSENKTVFRFKYDHKIDPDHFITFSAERKSGVDKTSINPYEGDTTARLDFRTVFN